MSPDPKLPRQQRKQLLILQGQVFRAEVAHAQHELRASLEPKALVGRVVSEVFGSRAGLVRRLFGATSSQLEGRMHYLLPLAGKTLVFLAARKLLRPAALTLLAGLAGWVAYRALKRPKDTGLLAEPGPEPQPVQLN